MPERESKAKQKINPVISFLISSMIFTTSFIIAVVLTCGLDSAIGENNGIAPLIFFGAGFFLLIFTFHRFAKWRNPGYAANEGANF